ncbi:MAG: exopolysaccharide biosynthesis polyprenyl glycosylphosphotransferase [Hyphomicrobium sp.]|nr:exopolysaccharide biosynthesis polyprenyl glycosylphosphotransferase [Hyphomicrobium sp.]
MTIRAERIQDVLHHGRVRFHLSGFGFTLVSLALDVAAILSAAVLTGLGWHLWAYGEAGEIGNYVTVGGLGALFYVLPFIFRNEYRVQDYIDGHRDIARTFFVWNCAFLCLGVIGFLTKTTGIVSRGGLTLFYIAGFLLAAAASSSLTMLLDRLISSGRVSARRIMLVGPADEIERVAKDFEPVRSGVRVIGSQVLPDICKAETGGAVLKSALEEAVAKARALGVDDIIVLVEWSRDSLMHEIVEAFRVLPVSIHLGASRQLGRFSDARVSRFSSVTALSLTEPPLGPAQEATKRMFDIIVAGIALVLLAPVFAVIGLLIKATSEGPVFFRQRRRGFNGREFRIWKFRTMTTMDDGNHVVQARPNDLRVTWIGRHLRRTNLDELPQLLNVLMGQMSLVGPRPHAVAHDMHYENRIVSYPRRLNMKPGITGWAQVNGFRGRTETDDAMRSRVEHDLYYIDNWSILFDLYILVLTVVSPKARRNAY